MPQLSSDISCDHIAPILARAFPTAREANATSVTPLASRGIINPVYLVNATIVHSDLRVEQMEFVLKVCPSLPQWRKVKVQCEATMLIFLRNHLASPRNRRLVPNVFDYDTDGSVLVVDGTGYEYLLLEKMRGRQVYEALEGKEYPQSSKLKLLEELAHFMADFKSFWIPHDELSSGSIQHIELVDPVTRRIRVTPGPDSDSCVPPQDSPAKLIKLNVEHYLRRTDMVIEQIRNSPKLDGEEVEIGASAHGTRPGRTLKSSERYQDLKDKMTRWLELRFDGARSKELADLTWSEIAQKLGTKDLLHLSHCDINGNILVDPETLELCAVLDFEWAQLQHPLVDYTDMELPGVEKAEFDSMFAAEWSRLPTEVTAGNGRALPPFPPANNEFTKQYDYLCSVYNTAVNLGCFHAWEFSHEDMIKNCQDLERRVGAALEGLNRETQ